MTPSLGSVGHFRVDETLLDSLEESVVIVGNASSASADLDFSSSSSSSSDDEEGNSFIHLIIHPYNSFIHSIIQLFIH